MASNSYLCRTCLTKEGKPKKMKQLNDELLQRIEELSGIELTLHEDYPTRICPTCIEMLDVASKFRDLCRTSENTLLGFLVKPEMKIEPADVEEEIEEFSVKSDNDNFFDELIEAREVEDISEIADFTMEEVELKEDDSSFEHIASETESILSLINEQPRKKRIKQKKITAQPKVPGKRGRKKNEEGNIMCEICGNIYKQRNLLNMHMRRHLEYKPFECEICGKSFACPSEIRRHMRTHTGEKPYVCKYCGRSFADRSTNIKHERIHTNTRPFSCSTCGKSFTYSNVLKNHMLTHTGEKPFPCLACNKTFSRKHQLDQHCATITHQQTVKCLANGEEFITSDVMNVENLGSLLVMSKVGQD